MKELYKDIREVIEFYFDRKLKNSTYYGEQEIWDIVEECIDEIDDICDRYDKEVDEYIYEREEAWEQEKENLKGKGIFL